MARYECERCGVTCHTTDEPHLCKDIARRLRRREAQVQAVITILLYDPQEIRPRGEREIAEAIVQKLSQMGVTDD